MGTIYQLGQLKHHHDGSFTTPKTKTLLNLFEKLTQKTVTPVRVTGKV